MPESGLEKGALEDDFYIIEWSLYTVPIAEIISVENEEHGVSMVSY